ncbi:MAG: para-aminobenzoate synthase, component I, para-aminobenzoate synthetase component I [Candidatus Peregrinibacteria bacterium GW2011_GWF2_43_17]|nr:MAG: para-aminobenzoate synthase, component I, para-aminobenzoate synthetase component I [Candidatus Peregrinibacteria bacterium GW2011_GWF2_43_17]KKT19585.1 MAG: Aminodeoxychorismate synthase, component I [Candidatus Peregrinibacteria bacterium GW2011_GWA2_43_8]HAU39972.1 hypothetical protein [Candidatus Peregrinibacteria bacterium]
MKYVEIKIRDFDPILFFRKVAAHEKGVSFLHGGRWSFIGFNPVKKFVSKEADFEGVSLTRNNLNYGAKNASHFCAVGYFSYDLGYKLFKIKRSAKDDLGMPLIYLNFYKDFLRFDNLKKKIFTTAPGKVREIWAKPCAYRENIVTNFEPEMSKKTYDRAFEKIREYILDGDIYQVNLTHRLVADFDGNHADLFCKILETNPAEMAAYLDLGEVKILSASPERFLRLEQGALSTAKRGQNDSMYRPGTATLSGTVYTCPVKGTRPRGKTPAEDAKMRDELLKSKKEEAELNMITDLLRNDIGQVCEIGSVRVAKHRAIQKCPTVWHTYSEVVGTLRKDLSAVDLLRACLPGGSITGCPKKRAMEIIDELEPVCRGVYTGAIGYIDGSGDMDTNIAIRTLVAKNGKLYLNVGGGIVADSTRESEYEETLDKAKSFLKLREPSAIFDPANKKLKGVFETMRTYGREIFMLDLHLKRLAKSARIIEMKLPASVSEIREMVLKSVEGSKLKPPFRIKCVVTSKDIAIDVMHLEIDPEIYKGVKVVSLKLERKKPQAKALPYFKSVEANKFAVSRGAYEAILVDRKGFVTEGAYSNVFWVKDGQVYTRRDGVLEGVTRQVVLDSVNVKFARATVADLQNADEVFITKTTTGMVPIVEIDGREIEAGEVTKRLMELTRERGMS